jgi:hypothetical protein
MQEIWCLPQQFFCSEVILRRFRCFQNVCSYQFWVKQQLAKYRGVYDRLRTLFINNMPICTYLKKQYKHLHLDFVQSTSLVICLCKSAITKVHMKLFNSVDKIMEKCFFPVIHHLAVTIKAKFIPTELFKNFCLRKKCRIR